MAEHEPNCAAMLFEQKTGMADPEGCCCWYAFRIAALEAALRELLEAEENSPRGMAAEAQARALLAEEAADPLS